MRKTLAIAVAAVALTLGGACTQRPVGERPLRRVRFRRAAPPRAEVPAPVPLTDP